MILIPNRVIIAAALAGNNLIVAAPAAGLRIVALNHFLEANGGANTLQWQSNATNISAPFNAVVGEQFFFDFAVYPWIFCSPGESLNLNLTAATSVIGWLNYLIQPVVT